MPYSPLRGHGLLLPSGPVGNHLFLVVNDACPTNQHLLLSITTIYPTKYHDPTCVLSTGHGFIVHPSYVLYRKPEVRATANLENCVNRGLFTYHGDFDPATVQAIRNGIAQSPHTPRWAIDYYTKLPPGL